jgi:hypothetical protein
VIPRFFDVGHHDFLGVGIRIGAALAKFLRSPETEHFVATGDCLEPEFLVEDEFALKAFFAIFHAAHGNPPGVAADSSASIWALPAQTKRLAIGQYAARLVQCGISGRNPLMWRIAD